MKRLLILVLAFALAAALFLTRPTKADFEKYIRAEGVKIAADTASKSAADLYLEQCTFENRVFWTNVKFNGKPAFTGAVGHWFERNASGS